MAKKKSKCSSGFSCGRSCIQRSRKCRSNIGASGKKVVENYAQFVSRVSQESAAPTALGPEAPAADPKPKKTPEPTPKPTPTLEATPTPEAQPTLTAQPTPTPEVTPTVSKKGKASKGKAKPNTKKKKKRKKPANSLDDILGQIDEEITSKAESERLTRNKKLSKEFAEANKKRQQEAVGKRPGTSRDVMDPEIKNTSDRISNALDSYDSDAAAQAILKNPKLQEAILTIPDNGNNAAQALKEVYKLDTEAAIVDDLETVDGSVFYRGWANKSQQEAETRASEVRTGKGDAYFVGLGKYGNGNYAAEVNEKGPNERNQQEEASSYADVSTGGKSFAATEDDIVAAQASYVVKGKLLSDAKIMNSQEQFETSQAFARDVADKIRETNPALANALTSDLATMSILAGYDAARVDDREGYTVYYNRGALAMDKNNYFIPKNERTRGI